MDDTTGTTIKKASSRFQNPQGRLIPPVFGGGDSAQPFPRSVLNVKARSPRFRPVPPLKLSAPPSNSHDGDSSTKEPSPHSRTSQQTISTVNIHLHPISSPPPFIASLDPHTPVPLTPGSTLTVRPVNPRRWSNEKVRNIPNRKDRGFRSCDSDALDEKLNTEVDAIIHATDYSSRKASECVDRDTKKTNLKKRKAEGIDTNEECMKNHGRSTAMQQNYNRFWCPYTYCEHTERMKAEHKETTRIRKLTRTETRETLACLGGHLSCGMRCINGTLAPDKGGSRFAFSST